MSEYHQRRLAQYEAEVRRSLPEGAERLMFNHQLGSYAFFLNGGRWGYETYLAIPNPSPTEWDKGQISKFRVNHAGEITRLRQDNIGIRVGWENGDVIRAVENHLELVHLGLNPNLYPKDATYQGLINDQLNGIERMITGHPTRMVVVQPKPKA